MTMKAKSTLYIHILFTFEINPNHWHLWKNQHSGSRKYLYRPAFKSWPFRKQCLQLHKGLSTQITRGENTHVTVEESSRSRSLWDSSFHIIDYVFTHTSHKIHKLFLTVFWTGVWEKLCFISMVTMATLLNIQIFRGLWG